MNFSYLLMLDEAPVESSMTSSLFPLVSLGLLGLAFYFFIYRPQKKQEKETAEMRSSVELGDIIVTAGGIVGMVVKVTEDMILIETSGNRSKIQIQKWAVQSILERANEPDTKEVKEVKRVDSDVKMKSKEDKSEKKSLFGKKNKED